MTNLIRTCIGCHPPFSRQLESIHSFNNIHRMPRPGVWKPYIWHSSPLSSYSLAFSPYNDSVLAVVSSQNFGLVGNGRLDILTISPEGIKSVNRFGICGDVLTA